MHSNNDPAMEFSGFIEMVVQNHQPPGAVIFVRESIDKMARIFVPPKWAGMLETAGRVRVRVTDVKPDGVEADWAADHIAHVAV